jgi:hypothetical protein
MKSITERALEIIEETRAKFKAELGKNPQDEKRDFINWYLQRHSGPFNVLINDLSEYYLHISEDRILRLLNEKR